jgi:hypothetical protein
MGKDITGGLPANLEFEGWVLGSILNDFAKYLPKAAAILQPDDFFLQKNQVIYGRMLQMDRKGRAVDRGTLGEAFTEKELRSIGIGYLNSLDDGLPEMSHFDDYVKIVKDKSVRRSFISVAENMTVKGMGKGDDTDALLTSGIESLRRLQAQNGHAPEAPPAVPQWPEPLHDDAFHGVAGELVRVLEPRTEADVAALLVQTLVGWGNMAGRGPYYLVEADYHHANEYSVLVGVSSKARKGTSWGRIESIQRVLDSHWTDNCLLEGVGSGEGLLDALAGEDKRALVNEGEFARLLAIISREGSTISANLRTAWDKGKLSLKTRQNKVNVTGAHVSMIGHITRDELLRRLDATEMANGFGNRILWVCVKRSKKLPHGGGISDDLAPISRRISEITDQVRRMGNTRMEFDAEARLLWEQVYDELSEGRPGMLGAMTSRAEAHVVRLSLTYALLDCTEKNRSRKIGVEHLKAALAVWRYCEDSCRYIWGRCTGRCHSRCAAAGAAGGRP